MKRAYIIEGLDRLGKSTLIDGIMQAGGFYQVIHYEKPKLLHTYLQNHLENYPRSDEASAKRQALFRYQRDSFYAMFDILSSAARVILDRAHLGECVYAPMYRKYSGDYIFRLEHEFDMDEYDDIRMILLTENFNMSNHFIEDGGSFDPTKRAEEQALFVQAFEKSIMRDKKIICVTGEDGKFRPASDILKEAIA
jgi:thymidylate kinase